MSSVQRWIWIWRQRSPKGEPIWSEIDSRRETKRSQNTGFKYVSNTFTNKIQPIKKRTSLVMSARAYLKALIIDKSWLSNRVLEKE